MTNPGMLGNMLAALYGCQCMQGLCLSSSIG